MGALCSRAIFVATLGDDEPASAGGDVDVGEPVLQVAVGQSHTCALLSGGRVKCWGMGVTGQLGYADRRTIGDKELLSSVGVVDVPELQICERAPECCVGDTEPPSTVGEVVIERGRD